MAQRGVRWRTSGALAFVVGAALLAACTAPVTDAAGPPTTGAPTTTSMLTSTPTSPSTVTAVEGGHDGSAPGGGPTVPDDATGPYPVVDVVDGDTIKVLIDGERVTVRVIGIDTPETRDPRKPVQCFGREATARAEVLLDGREVRLTTDPTQDTYDRYDRLLAYVWLPDGRLFEWEMVAGGYAHEYTYDLPYRYQAELQDAERSARERGVGLWAPTTCAGDTTTAVE